MIIAQISDTHIALDTADADQRIKDFERTIADINALDPLPDVIVHTGDVVHNGRADEYAVAAAVLSQARVPVYVMVGNKDNRSNLRDAFSGKGYLEPGAKFIAYAIEGFPVRLIALDTLDLQSNKGGFCTDRAKNLSDLVDADTEKPIAVFSHHPPFEVRVGPEPMNFHSHCDMSHLTQTLQASGRVIAVFSGHVHRPDFGYVGTIPATVVPPVATPLRWGTYPDCMAIRPIYSLHQYDPVWGFSTTTQIVGVA